ncbi:MAG: class I SAM-dependent methyltransferase [SAR324 cluster bacterium]|nr:class I SAM-dependent methyltransferase [SAR324 cluster bacterium]
MTSFGGRHNRTSFRENLINKVIFSTADLTKQDCERIAEDDLLFSIAITNKNKCFLDYLSSFYSVHPMSVKEIIDRDIEVWVKGIKSTEGTTWDRPLRAKTISRFVVAKYNANIIEYINNLFLNNKGKRYLDVGCGTGLSLLSAIDAGFDEVIGYEYSAGYTTMSKCVTQIYKEGDKNPVSYYDADYLTAEDKGKYDLITFFDVLEHINPAKFALSKAIKSLKKNGVIYAYQGNSYSPAMVLNEPHYGLPLLTLLPRSIVVNILMRSGRIQQESNYVVNSWPRLSEIDAWARGINAL